VIRWNGLIIGESVSLFFSVYFRCNTECSLARTAHSGFSFVSGIGIGIGCLDCSGLIVNGCNERYLLPFCFFNDSNYLS
jgi:hypothetical protein